MFHDLYGVLLWHPDHQRGLPWAVFEAMRQGADKHLRDMEARNRG